MSESDATSLNSDPSLDLKSAINESENFAYLPKIKKGIEELKTKLKNKINYNSRNLNNEDENNYSYPLEFLDIFPNLIKAYINSDLDDINFEEKESVSNSNYFLMLII